MESSLPKAKRRYVIYLFGFTSTVLCIYASRLSVPVISDETITMANAVWFEGYDWSWMVAALGGFYYRYIQAFMTIPFFSFLKDPDMIYRLSMVLQAVIQSSIVLVVYVICQRHLKIRSEWLASLLGMAVCLIPSMALYTFYYRGDYLLGVVPWYALLSFLETMEASEQKKPVRRVGYTLLTVLFCLIGYMAHTRGIILIIALFLSTACLRMFWKKKSLHLPTLIVTGVGLFAVDFMMGELLKKAIYSIGGLQANAIESTDMGVYFSVFSLSTAKGLIMLCLSWLHTLVVTTQGLVLIGIIVFGVVVWKVMINRDETITVQERVTVLFSGLVFAGYYAVGALFFKSVYYELTSGQLERRVDRLLYDRYAICGAGMIVFLALYVLCCRREWLKAKGQVICVCAAIGVMAVFLWKILPIATRYRGYIYNTISLNTFQKVKVPINILFGEYYGKWALIGASVLGIGSMIAVVVAASLKKKWAPYAVLAVVLVSDLVLIHVNYGKIRKASNDYVVEVTQEVVDFMQGFEEEITEEFPYVLKGGMSGVRIQFYQSQLMSYQMFGKDQEEMLGQDNYFIISKKGDISPDYYEEDYYLFEDFDYENASYDIVYVKGEKLKNKLEELGYEMEKYQYECKR